MEDGKRKVIDLYGEKIKVDEHGFPILEPPPEPSEEYI